MSLRGSFHHAKQNQEVGNNKLLGGFVKPYLRVKQLIINFPF